MYPAHVPAPKTDGVYFDLPELDYHNDPALGSSDMRMLAKSPADFWVKSKFNPSWQPMESSPALIFGTATHKRILEGKKAFDTRYAPAYHPGNITAGKREREAIEQAGRRWLKADEWEWIQDAALVVESDPHVGRVFTDGAASEVTIFWEKNGIRKKCRIDYLRYAASIDLKTKSNELDKPFDQCCREGIAQYDYGAQAAHYNEGREYLSEFFRDGKVFGEPTDWNEFEHAAVNADWSFIFVFIQKQGAPRVWSTKLAKSNSLLLAGSTILNRAEQQWSNFTKKFGLERRWVDPYPFEEFDIEQMPTWWKYQNGFMR